MEGTGGGGKALFGAKPAEPVVTAPVETPKQRAEEGNRQGRAIARTVVGVASVASAKVKVRTAAMAAARAVSATKPVKDSNKSSAKVNVTVSAATAIATASRPRSKALSARRLKRASRSKVRRFAPRVRTRVKAAGSATRNVASANRVRAEKPARAGSRVSHVKTASRAKTVASATNKPRKPQPWPPKP